jgi:hypothetical protein
MHLKKQNQSVNKIAVIIFVLTFFSCAEKPKEEILSNELNTVKNNLNDYFTALTNLNKFNGVLLAYKNDTFLLEKGYNIYESPDSSSYVTSIHQFDIHSVSKLMTHYLIEKLKSKGKISENQTIEKFYPGFPNGNLITLEMLLEHSSGLPRELLDFKGNEFDLTSDEIVEFAKKQPLLFEPGEDSQYSNIGYELLYNIISKIYKKTFAQCVVDEIFVPLKMHRSGSHFFTDDKRPDNLAKNHILKDSTFIEVPNILEDEFKTARFYSTANDLHTFLKHLENEPFLTAIRNEKGVIAKDGGSKGIRAQVYADTEHNFSFVLLANYDEMPFFKTIEDVAKILKGEPFEIPKDLNRQSISVEREILERYVGSYSFADFDGLILTIKTDGENLVVFQDNEKIATLKAETETIFFENPKESESFEFIENDSGSYNALMGWKGITVEGERK